MKFYYNGQLARTSKTHIYTHAVVTENMQGLVVIGCCSRKELAEQLFNREWAEHNEYIDNLRSQIEAIKNGENTYLRKSGRKTYMAKTDRRFADKYPEWLAKAENSLWMENMRVVELEARQ